MPPLTFRGASLACPVCGQTYGLHLDGVSLAGRVEDGPMSTAHIDSECVVTYNDEVPAGPQVEEGRRYRIAIDGWCEFGTHPFSIVFTQHKGDTLVEVVHRAPRVT